MTDRNGKLRTIAVTVKPGAGVAKSSQLSFVDSSDGSKSWGSMSGDYSTQIDGLGTLCIRPTPSPDAQRCRLAATLTPPAAVATAKR